MTEEKYLDHVLERIRAAIGSADTTVRERVQTLDEQKRYLWENRDIDPHEIRSVRENILNIHTIGESVIARRERLGRMLDTPYFGRIDFNGEPVYIGIHTFHDFDTRASLIHDWRAPIASMYYDYELGPAAYSSPAGEGAGEISLKRQYRIRGGKMEYMLESSVTVHDEMQDYTPVQYRVIQRLFPCRKTLLGDAGQSVNPYGSSTAETIQKTFTGGKVMKLCKSYRSTFEITDFAQRIRCNDELEPVARHGEKPQILRFDTLETELTTIARLIADLRQSGYKSLGIICKTESQAAELHKRLSDPDIFLLTSRSHAFAHGVVITSAHMAKGLEFDEVIIPHADARNYHSEIDRSMLYVAATRAMHRLTLTHSETPSFANASIESSSNIHTLF